MEKSFWSAAMIVMFLFSFSSSVSAQDNGDQLKSAKNLYEQGAFTKNIF